jgi:hypothetical protein
VPGADEAKAASSINMITRSIFAGIIFFALAISAPAQTKPTTVTRTIDKYVKSIEKLTGSRKEPDLVMADAADIEAEKPDWKKFDSPAALEKARQEKETYTIAFNWKKNGKIVASNFTYFSQSGDWSQYVYHYFRENGTLARVDAELRTFNDDCVIKQRFYFNRAGKRLRKTLNYYDLTTNKPKERCLGADALKFDYSRSVAKLPFSRR